MRVLYAACALLLLASPDLSAESAYEQLLQAAPEQTRPRSEPAPLFEAVPVGLAEAPTRKAAGIGLSHSGDPFDIPHFSLRQIAGLLKEAGGTHYRPHLPLDEAVPEISAGTLEKLRRAGSDPALMDAMIDELARDGRWDRMDKLVDIFTGAGLELVLVTGAGYRKEAPRYALPDGSLQRVSPDRVGRDVYIALVRWLTGAAVRRYGDRVEVWQVENEINIAQFCMRVGWRVNEKSWADAEFLKKLLAALADTVHAEGRRMGRDLKTTHNFGTDVGWKDWVSKKSVDIGKDIGTFGVSSLDIVGVDVYANYFYGWPVHDERVGEVVSQTVEAADGRPVWVLETGFPNGPGPRGFSEKRQALYFRNGFDAAYAAGADVVLAFGWFWNPLGWYTDSPDPLPWWHPQAGEQHWSPIKLTPNPDGGTDIRFGKAWDEFVAAARRWVAD
ncbi:MAG: hypothetical protein ABII00_18395 [Elusimicrobiota bacterium]